MDRDDDIPIHSGIEGIDEVLGGGLTPDRFYLVEGRPGAGKTTLALQFLLEGVRQFGEPGVFVTFEERPDDLMENVASFGWDLPALVAAGKLAVVDASPEPGEMMIESGQYDLSALLARVENAVRRVGARRVILDAIGALFPQFSDANVVRRELHRINAGLRRLEQTTIMTMERTDEDGRLGRFGVEEFVADNVVILRNRLEMEKRRRPIESLKVRGRRTRRASTRSRSSPRRG